MNWFDQIIHNSIQKYEIECIKNSSRTVFLTNKMRLNYEKTIKDTTILDVISDCVSQRHLNHRIGPCCEQTRTQLKIPTNKEIILFVGRIAHEKGWNTYIQVANQLRDEKDVFFLVCGDGPQRAEMERYIEEHNLNDLVHITGFVSHTLIPCIMSMAKVLVIPSLHEELGGTALEGIAAGVPIVASDVGGLSGLFRSPNTAITVPPKDISGFVKSIRRLLYDDSLCALLAKTAKTTILEDYTPEYVLRKYIDLYKVEV